ncbi:MAG: hypothetical protein ACLUN6_04090 [Holdemanella sp.]|uniref:hypothetical protein n=1 Tax=Holdemanella sp. TaxID=1971762 RepID=UPI0039952EB6
MMAALRQDRFSPLHDWQQALLIFAVSGGYASKVEADDLNDFSSQLFSWFITKEPALTETLKTGRKLDDDTEAALHAALTAFAEALDGRTAAAQKAAEKHPRHRSARRGDAHRSRRSWHAAREARSARSSTPYAGGGAGTCSRCSAGSGSAAKRTVDPSPKNCLVLFGSNRGLLRRLQRRAFPLHVDRALAAEDETPHIISCAAARRAHIFASARSPMRSSFSPMCRITKRRTRAS